MSDLRLVAVDEEGTHLLLRHDTGETDLRLPIDERLHAALRGDRARLGQLEIAIDSQLRPKDIQARVRAGESVESVAHAAGVPLERVQRFAGPVLDERRHVADRARRSPVRRPGGEGPGTVLDDLVSTHLAGQGSDEGEVGWDAWRRDDGRWTVAATWRSGAKARAARWVFDAAGRSVTPDGEAARALSGDHPPATPSSAAAGRLAVVQEPAGDADRTSTQPIPTTPEAVAAMADTAQGTVDGGASGAAAGGHHPDVGEPYRRRTRARKRSDRGDDGRLRLSDLARHIEVSGDETADLDGAGVPGPATGGRVGEPGAPPATAPTASPVAAQPAGSGRQRVRPSVPSWDEIMFGRRRRSGE